MKKFQVFYGDSEDPNIDTVIAVRASIREGILIFEDEKSEPVAIYQERLWFKVSQITK